MANELAALDSAVVQLAHSQGDLENPGGFARVGFATDDRQLLRRNVINDFLVFARYGKGLWEFEVQRGKHWPHLSGYRLALGVWAAEKK